ncbi:MAG: hypothetical protein JWR08_961 [Enterovirga sp.]|nr:hypothetical protein [Enterovirga sp.]
MSAPSVPFAVWIWAAFDPLLILVAGYLGWKADQAGKIFIAAIAALGVSLLADWILTSLGVPLPAPLSRTGPMLLPVRSVAALAWAALAFAVHRGMRRRS